MKSNSLGGNLELTTEILATTPIYFAGLYGKIVTRIQSPEQLQTLADLVSTLHNAGCTEETIETLCVYGEFTSLSELANGRYAFRDYRDLGISVDQAWFLIEEMKQIRKQMEQARQKSAYRLQLIKTAYQKIIQRNNEAQAQEKVTAGA
ncbi:MAG: hypothetical protein PHT88_00365 [Candidatus Moranbacteria bacterium]|nr:hypothetical protein [Candidatus Moranbacteria bacterium]